MHDAAAGGIDKDRVRLHHRQLVIGDQSLCARGERHVNAQHVALPQDLLHRRRAPVRDVRPRRLRHERVVRDQLRVKGAPEDARDGLADVPHAQQAERLLVQDQPGAHLLGHQLALDLPLVDLGDLARDGHGQPEDELRDGAGVYARSVEDLDPPRGARVGVDLVDADPLLADGLEVRAGGNVLGGEIGGADEQVLGILPPVDMVLVAGLDCPEALLAVLYGFWVELVQEVDGRTAVVDGAGLPAAI